MTAASKTLPSNLAIVGAGRVGKSLAAAAEIAGVTCSIHRRDRPVGSLAAADVVLICTGDSEIEAAAAGLAGEIDDGAIVGHTSGATPLTVLAEATAACAGGFGIHPLQTIPGPDTSLAGIPAAVSATDPWTEQRALALAGLLGMAPFAIAEGDRAAYHAAATIASNFLFALEESAATLLASTGVEPAREALAQLVVSSARNWAGNGPAALTGPIARGDEQTIERHLEAIAEHAPELLPLYEVLAERTRAIAGRPEPVG